MRDTFAVRIWLILRELILFAKLVSFAKIRDQCISMKHISADRLDELDRQLLRATPAQFSTPVDRSRDGGDFMEGFPKPACIVPCVRICVRRRYGARIVACPVCFTREQMERYCELIAAVKLRTCNKKGRCLSTGETIRLLEEFGVETPEGLVKIDPGVLKRSTVNRYLKQWSFDKQSWTRQPAAVRFQAAHSNECWQFDLSPSDLKQIKEPPWLRSGSRRADADAVQRGGRSQRRGLSGVPLRVWRRCRVGVALPVQCDV